MHWKKTERVSWSSGRNSCRARNKLIGRLSSREVHRIHRWGRTFDGDGCGLHAKTLDHIKVFEDGTLLVVFLDGTGDSM
ncbi:MAG: hypothetical protein V8S08_08800 [Lachnoclostridium sp.]